MSASKITQTYYVTGTYIFPVTFNAVFIAVTTHRGAGSSTAIVNLLNNTTIGVRLGLPEQEPKALPWSSHFIVIGK